MNPRITLDRDAIIEQLSQLDSSHPDDAATSDPSSTVKELKAELDTLIGQLRQPAEPDPFADETGLRRAQELVLAIGVEPESKGHDHRPELGRIGPYELLEKLGEGGMGAVYKALHSSLEKIVALKVLPRDRLNPQAISRFKREMKAVGKLDHPNIVRATDAGEADGDHFLVMEYVEGVDLAELLRRVGPLPAAEACELVRQAAVGLQHAHQRGMVHRDIKPNNIMFAWSDEQSPVVKILDMGLALLNEQTAPAHGDLTTTGQMMGTLEYMSPEQGLDTHNVDIRADIYSLGATLYKLLCGKAPFSDERNNTPGKFMVALATQTPPSIGTRRDDLPAGLIALVDRMLARQPADRPATPAEVAQALVLFASGADLPRLANTARQHGSSPNKTTDQSITPTEQFLSSPSTGTKATLKPEAQAKDFHEPEESASESAAHPSLALQASIPIPQSAIRNPKWLRLAAIAAGFLAVAAAVFGIIKISTPNGDYVIQTDDPDFSFSVSKGVVTLNDKKSKREYTLKVMREDNGVFDLDVTDVGADLSFKVKEFTIKRGQQVALKAHFERKPADVVTAPPVTDPDRRAAEWVLSIGGNIRIKENGQERGINADSELPRSEFELSFVYLQGNPKVSDEGLAHFQDCKNLTHLDLYGTQVSDAGLAYFKDCKNLTVLGLDATKVSDAGLAHFKDFKNVTRLNLGGTQVSDVGLAYFKDSKNLAHLDLMGARVSDEGLAHFQDCKNLSVLVLCLTPVSDVGLAHFKDSKNLTYLDLMGARVSDAGLAHFQDCKNLSVLVLSNTQVSDAGLSHIKNCKNLTRLHLDGTRVSDEGLAHLAGFLKVVSVYAQNTKVTEAGVKKLSAALPGCKIEWDGGVIEPSLSTDSDRSVAEWLVSRKAYGIGINVPTGFVSLKVNEALPEETTTLIAANLFQDQTLTPEDFKRFTKLRLFSTLILNETNTSDAHLAQLGELPELTKVYLYQTKITDAGLKHLLNYPKLELLHLTHTAITDDATETLQSLRNLKELHLTGAKVTEAGVKKLSAALPECKIEWDGVVIEPRK